MLFFLKGEVAKREVGNEEIIRLSGGGADAAAGADVGLAGRGLPGGQGVLVLFPEVGFGDAVLDEVPGEEFVGHAFPHDEKVGV